MRLNKYISQSGYCSRRSADVLIEHGKVSVNGNVVRTLGYIVDPIKDKVKVEGNKISLPISKTYIVFYKPRGILSTMSSESKSLLPYIQSMSVPGLVHVGRLDQESEGLLLLSNDGDWSNRISHPRYQIEKEYEVDLDSRLSPEVLSTLKLGIGLDDGLFRADEVVSIGENKVRLVIHDGRNRVIRRAFESLGFEVLKLKRTRVGSVSLGRMRPGEWKQIEASSINK